MILECELRDADIEGRLSDEVARFVSAIMDLAGRWDALMGLLSLSSWLV